MSETAEQYIARLTGYVGSQPPLDILTATPVRLGEMLHALTDEIADFKPAPGKWSIRQVVAHLADAEIAVAARLRWAAAEPGKAGAAYDQDKLATTARYAEVPLQLSFATFTAVRQWTITFLRKLSPEQWDGFLVHEERGKETVAQMVRLLAGHDLNHLQQIEALLQSRRQVAEQA